MNLEGAVVMLLKCEAKGKNKNYLNQTEREALTILLNEFRHKYQIKKVQLINPTTKG